MKQERRTRSDKKVDVKPLLPVSIKMELYETAYLLDKPIKDMAESICLKSIKNEHIIQYLSNYFRREYLFKSTLIMGRPERSRFIVSFDGECEKITIKFHQRDYDEVSKLAFSLDLTPTTTVSLLLRIAYHNKLFHTFGK